MIKLEVQDYCQECDYFLADVEMPTFKFTNATGVYKSDTVIRCERRELCARLQREFEQMQKEKENGGC